MRSAMRLPLPPRDGVRPDTPLRLNVAAALAFPDGSVTASERFEMTRSTALSAVRPIPRRGLSRVEAAMYIGVSAGKFDELVRDGRMPGPKRIDGRKIWDVRDLDVAFDALPSENPQSQGSSWDDFRQEHD